MSSRKPVKPIQEPTASEAARHTNVLLEKLSREFKAFGEGLKSVRERVDRMEPTLNQVAQDVGLLNTWARKCSLELTSLHDKMKTFTSRLEALEIK